MRKLIIVLIVLFIIPLVINAQVIHELNEQITFDREGNAELKVFLKSEKGYFKELLIPFNCKGENKEVLGENLFVAKKISIQGIDYLYVSKLDSSNFKECTIIVKIKKYYDFNSEEISDFRNYLLKYRFINTRFPLIKNYSLKIILPNNYNITSIDESIPKATEDSPKSPFKLGNNNGNYFVELNGEDVKLGENLYIKFRFKENEKSMLLGILFGIIAIGYLIVFRDLRKPKANK